MFVEGGFFGVGGLPRLAASFVECIARKCQVHLFKVFYIFLCLLCAASAKGPLVFAGVVIPGFVVLAFGSVSGCTESLFRGYWG
jgi:hypothetical protein